VKQSLSVKWFLWLSIVVAVFCIAQTIAVVWLEVQEVLSSEETWAEEGSQIVILLSVSASVFVLMLGCFWFVSKRMILPIRLISESADRISQGDLMERVESKSTADEIESLASALNRAFDRYNEVVRRLDRFAGNAAHQLRTPLASVRSIGEVCLQKERSAPEYRDCIESMLEATRELSDIIEKLLMIARLNPLRVRQRFVTVDVSNVVSQTLDVYGASMQEKNIQCDRQVANNLEITGDMALAGQAIRNVVDNAVRFTPQGGNIAVSLQNTNGNTVLEIRDTGPGIPQNVFDVLMPNGTNSQIGSELPSGRLGLALVFEIMKIHEGTFQIVPVDDDGACVRLVWPHRRDCNRMP